MQDLGLYASTPVINPSIHPHSNIKDHIVVVASNCKLCILCILADPPLQAVESKHF